MSRSWCITGFVNIVGSYGVFPSLSCCDELSFSLWDFVDIGLNTFMDWEHLIYVLQLNTRGDNGVSYWFTWYIFWHSTRGFRRWHWGNLCIGIDARSCLCFSGGNLGALFEVLCVGLNIMNLNLLWCYFSMKSWLDRSERIAWCYFSTNSRIDWSERIALRWFRTLQMIPSYVLH